jgi:hypothetical protein
LLKWSAKKDNNVNVGVRMQLSPSKSPCRENGNLTALSREWARRPGKGLLNHFFKELSHPPKNKSGTFALIVKCLDSIQLLLEFVASHGVRETVAWRPPEER